MHLALAARRALLRLADRVVPAQAAMVFRIGGIGQTAALRAAARLRVADHLDRTAMTSAELARLTDSDPDALHRVMRALVTEGVFALDRDGRFKHNRLSLALRSGVTGSVRDFADYFGSDSNVSAWSGLEETLHDGSHAFEREHGMTVWAWFDEHTDERDVFAGAMGSLTELYAPAVAASAPFAGLTRLCDVGAGRGTLLAEILRRHPHTQGAWIDNHGVQDPARAYLLAEGVLARVELYPGSFFEGVPEGCDAYLLKNVLHDWDDATCLKILATVRRAAPVGARVLIVEALVEAHTTTDMGPLSDLQMMISTPGGRERGAEELRSLLERSGFELADVVHTASPMSVVVARAVLEPHHARP